MEIIISTRIRQDGNVDFLILYSPLLIRLVPLDISAQNAEVGDKRVIDKTMEEVYSIQHSILERKGVWLITQDTLAIIKKKHEDTINNPCNSSDFSNFYEERSITLLLNILNIILSE